MSRSFAICIEDESIPAENAVNAANKIKTKFSNDKVFVFKKEPLDIQCLDGIDAVNMPNSCDNAAKMKNFMIDYIKANSNCRFLHLIESCVCIDDGIEKFIMEVENAMDVLDYSIYFSTSTDRCNYVYSKMNPRITIDLDDDDCRKLNLPEKICFTSHSNTIWVSYDLEKLDDVPKFNEQFSIMMYIIIEYLARRKASKTENQLYFMNQYLSIPSEQYAFHVLDIKRDPPDPSKMKAEDAIFKLMDVDYSPDNNIDIILELFHRKIQEKANHTSN